MKITGTHTRTKKTMRKYYDVMNERHTARKNRKPSVNPFLKKSIISFDHWEIIENDFPYDAIADVSHMLFPKRDFVFDWDLMNIKEREELDTLKKTYFNDNYDVVYENLPGAQTIPGRFHLHLLKLKRYEIDSEK
ncbi:MAG: hypothetical protein ACPGTS_01390 [Minisyncoccia bacterium]